MIRPLATLLAILGVMVLGLVWITGTWHGSGSPLAVSVRQNADLLELTATTGRLAGENVYRTTIAYSQTVYAAAQDKDRPGAVVLVRDDDPATAMATTRLQHFPVNAPMLFVTAGGTMLPRAVLEEINRLGPEGVMMDNNVQIYLCGDIDPAIGAYLGDVWDYRTRSIRASDPVAYTEMLDEFIAVMDSNHADRVLVASLDALPYAFGASNWNAHMGAGWVFVTADGVPDATRRILERRAPNYPYIYVFAPRAEVGDGILAELTQYGHVQRIPGETPQEMAVRWAGYKDLGRMVGWWFGKAHRDVGWGYAEPGHNVILGNPGDWRTLVPSGVLSHMGKHAMLLLTEPDGSLPDAARGWLEVLQPTRTHPSEQVFNHGWVLGGDELVPDETVYELAELLAIPGTYAAPAPPYTYDMAVTPADEEQVEKVGHIVAFPPIVSPLAFAGLGFFGLWVLWPYPLRRRRTTEDK